MNTDALRCRLASLIGRHITFYIEDGVLRYRGPRNAITDDDLAWLATHTATIAEMITAADADTLERVWWMDYTLAIPIIWIPLETECHAPIACSRFGPCKSLIPGMVCDVTKLTQLDQEAA